ncbi:putative bifunctional diguanylate cyclase/phosphodiesterase [Gluconobacter morbifer]|uniref:Sensory box/GGDEF family protein n=1 Tax=Gluconobacter morbifer G707 TaxID=1088869 RepID=G6XFP3_9PROT|nr:bifunctional diguanylate cyclase/phosphodiesterase [Gluconobacter morbifer]EHH69001.1 sensory box/GGDEF family protein [Gluconobacter morbifer G707]
MARLSITSLHDIACEGLAILRQGRVVEANLPFLSLFDCPLKDLPPLTDFLPAALTAPPDGQNRAALLYRVHNGIMAIHFRLYAICWQQDLCMALAITLSSPDKKPSLTDPARHDPVTHLLVREDFNEQVRTFFRNRLDRNPAGALFFLDIQRFHTINDFYGQSAGNRVLQTLANRLQDALPDTCRMGRIGDDEFGVFCPLPYDNPAQARHIAQTIRDVCHSPLDQGNERLHLTVRIGYCLLPHDTASFDMACHYADLALQAAKKNPTRDWIHFEPGMARRASARSEMEHDLRTALTKQQFFLDFQPILDLRTSRLKGVEALLRWHHPVHGIISPLDFIPVAEDSGLIVAIGRWVLLDACRQGLLLPPDTGMAINISPIQFQNDDLYAVVLQSLQQTGFPASRLELELTERIFLEADQKNLRTLEKIRALGVHIVMDDFGIGYSSLNYLRRFPFDCLKIDRSFIQDMIQDDRIRSIVDAILHLAQALGIDVVAEGIEAPEQLHALQTTKCQTGQGFLLGCPGPLTNLICLFPNNPTKSGPSS